MKCDLLVVATDLSGRRHLHAPLEKSLKGYKFQRRVLALSCYEDGKHGFNGSGWSPVIGENRSLYQNIVAGLEKITSEWMVYCEDDVRIRRLPLDDMEHLREEHEVRFLSLNIAGCHDRQQDYCCRGYWIKEDGDPYSISFPVAIVETSLFRQIVSGAEKYVDQAPKRKYRRRFTAPQIERTFSTVFAGIPNHGAAASTWPPEPEDALMDYIDNGYDSTHTSSLNSYARVLL